jgi:hypothetical protein
MKGYRGGVNDSSQLGFTCGYGFGSRVRHCFDRHVV